MRSLYTSQDIKIPQGVTVECRARNVRVKGPRGTLFKNLKHLNFEVTRVADKMRVKLYHGTKKQNACIRTVCSHITNMIVGVTQGFRYKMRYAYAHFPITVNVVDSDNIVEIRNFLGEKLIRRVNILDGVKVEISTAQKDELILTGNCIENVSQTAASIQQNTNVRNKDIRKFLDGIYVSEKGAIPVEE